MPNVPDARAPHWIERSGRISWLLLGIAGALAVLVVSVQWLSSLVIPLVLAAFLAAVFEPLVSWLGDKGVPRSIGAALVLLGVAAVFVGSLVLVVVGIVDKADELSAQLDAAQEELAELSDNWNLDQYLEQFRETLSSGNGGAGSGIGASVGSAVGSAASFLSGLAMGVILFYYLLRDGPSLVRSAVLRYQPERARTLARIVETSIGSVRSYMRGRTILAVVQGVAVGVAVWVIGVPLPLAIGVVTFITAYIPYLGALIGGAFAVLMALSEGGMIDAVWALAIVVFVNVVLENLLEPAVQGSSLNLHPIVILLVTVFGGLVAGIVGFILASPLAAIARNLYRELTDSGFFDPPGDEVAEIAPVSDPP